MEEAAEYNSDITLEKIRERGNLELYHIMKGNPFVVACTVTGHYLEINKNDLMEQLQTEPFRYIVLEKGEYIENDITVVIY